MNYTEMLFNRDERLVNLLNQADNKNLELIVELNKKEDEIERLNNIIKEVRECVETAISEDYYDGEIYKIKEILNKGESND